MLVVGLLIGLVVLIGLGVLGLGALVLWGSARNLWERWAAFVSAMQSRGWAETEGTMVRSAVAHRRFRRHVSYEPAIRYEYWVGGQRLESERRRFEEAEVGSFETARAAVDKLPAGSRHRVYYDARAPRRSTLARDVPPVLWSSLGWCLVALIGVALAALGGDIAIGAFTEPPKLEELPSLRAQIGGVFVGAGAVIVAYAGIRSLLERKRRLLLRVVAAAKPTSAGEVQVGERVAVFGRAEAELEGEGDELERLLGERPLFYLHSDLGSPDHHLTRVAPFALRDETGRVLVDLSDGEPLLGTQAIAITGDLERWLDRHDLELGSSVSGDRRATMNVARLHEGDPVLVAGQVFRDSGGERVLRAREGEPLSLVFTDKPLAATLEELGKGPRATLAWGAAGVLSILLGAVALLS